MKKNNKWIILISMSLFLSGTIIASGFLINEVVKKVNKK